MKMATITIPLCELHELSDMAKRKAIEGHRDFLLGVMQPSDFISGDPEYDTPEQLSEAYKKEFEYYSFNDEPIIESIEANGYLFYMDGELAHVVEYVAGPMEGKTILNIHGSAFAI